MVAVCAFLIILVILFGIEGVRSFIFGSFGVLAWVILGILGLGAIISLGEWWHKELEEDKKRRKAAKKAGERMKVWPFVLFGSFILIFLGLLIALVITSQQK